MPLNGAGTFVRLYSWVTDKANSIKIIAQRVDDEMNGMATGISTAIMRDGQSTVTAPISWNNQRLKDLGPATADQDAISRIFADARFAKLTSGVPVGSLIDVVGINAPAGYLKANGTLMSRTTYADLWTYVQGSGAIYNDTDWTNFKGGFSSGDGTTTFRLPDFRGEFRRGWDDGRGQDVGRAAGSVQAQMIQDHVHRIGTAAVGGDGAAARNTVLNVFDNSVLSSTPTAGSGAETRPRNLPILTCIKF